MILPTNCPHCSVNLEGEDILPQERAILESASTRWSRVQLIVEKGIAVTFKCPDCQHEWPVPWAPKGSAKDVE